MSFFFGGNTGMTYEEMQRKRMVADALMKQQRPSRNVGEGVGSFAKQISGALINRNLNKRDRELQREADEMFGSVFGGGGSPAMAGTAQPSYATPERNAAMAQNGGPTQAAAGQMAGNFPASLVRTESGGNWNALNDVEGAGGIKGHGGRLQFGGARLQDAARAGVVPPMSPQEFAQQPPEVQQRVEQWHFSDIDQQAKQMGLERFIGQTVGGIPINRNAIRAMAHLGGVGGAAKFLQSGGQINPADVNGTSLADYARTHGQGQRGQPAGVQVANAGGGGPGMAEIARALSNPYIRRDPGKMAILQSLMQNRMNANDPMARIEMQRAQQQLQLGNIELERARNPQPEMTANQRNYEYLIGQGVDPEAAREMTFGGGGVRVENNMPGPNNEPMPEIGTIPQGYTAVPDPSSPAGYRMELIPGGPAQEEAEAAERQKEGQSELTQRAGGVVFDDLGRLITMIEGGEGDDRNQPITGAAGAMAGLLPGTEARDARALRDTIVANIGFDRLQQMREASPTGGALGAVSERELSTLQAVLGNLEFSQSKPQLLRNLRRVEEIYSNILDKAARTGDGSFVPRADDQPQTQSSQMDFSQMGDDEIMQLDINAIPDDELDAYLERIEKVGR